MAANPPAEKNAEAIQLIDKALALPSRQGKAMGKVYHHGLPVSYTAEYAFHFPDRWNVRIILNPTGAKIPLTTVHDKP
jgi:hypothetical protein